MHDVCTILRELHDEYVERINLAVSEGRYDLVEALSEEFTDVSLTALLDAGTTQNRMTPPSVGRP